MTTTVKFGPDLLWTDRELNWAIVEWYRLDKKTLEPWIEEHCVDEVWVKQGSYVWNSAYYFENPKEALLFRVTWT